MNEYYLIKSLDPNKLKHENTEEYEWEFNREINIDPNLVKDDESFKNLTK